MHRLQGQAVDTNKASNTGWVSLKHEIITIPLYNIDK